MRFPWGEQEGENRQDGGNSVRNGPASASECGLRYVYCVTDMGGALCHMEAALGHRYLQLSPVLSTS